jgi:NAD(P)-dependent dehydrogenase (short-subunit alcohol dehydrogenase family)
MSDVALVTGAGGALGAEVARVLAGRGHALALLDSEAGKERLEALARSLGRATAITGDLTVQSTWSDAMARIERELGAAPAAAALIAGGWRGGQRLHEESDDTIWRAMMAANLETAHLGLRALLPPMVARKAGSVVVMGSRVVEQPWTGAGATAYVASKSALVALARTVAAEVLEHGVRINAVLPSTMDTPANRRAMPQVDPARWVSLSSAAGVIGFLLGDEARDVSGAALPLYGRA